jgi:hypothetical protein
MTLVKMTEKNSLPLNLGSGQENVMFRAIAMNSPAHASTS